MYFICNCWFIFSFQNSFADIARVLSEFFRDLDVVPSDVVVGLVLLRKRQQLLRLRTIHQVNEFTLHIFTISVSVPFSNYVLSTA